MDAAESAALAAPLTEEQREFRRTLRDLLAERAGPHQNPVATATSQGYDPELWTRLSATLGHVTLCTADHGPAELVLACEETGRALAPSPLLATRVLAAPLLTALGSPAQRAAHLPRLAAGSLTCALAVPGGALALALGLTGDNAAEDWSGGGRAGGVQARPDGEGWRLYGEAAQVLDGHSAGLLLVAAHAGGFARSRTLLFLVRAEGADVPGLVRTRQPALDPTRPRATVQFRDTRAELLGAEPADVLGTLAATGRHTAVMLAAEAVGAARAALDRGAAHACSRAGHAGSRGAAVHRLADLSVQVEAARTLTYSAAGESGPGGPGTGSGPEGGPLALAHALEALRATAEEAVRPADATAPFAARAASDELLFGPVRGLRARAAERTGLFREVAA
ncbi:acyl-CoA dehydrogenase family protein [Streptomyces exfoliatus]|uniref:acyl-CoA dehydrogenase family protein n=1 Tax=Streptomyces exfoliatus TaxID=1905 RepID=UPI0004CB370B|nr:acyl-CoA dehydrogenase family protein [Streptomyces exfoliatus]